MILTSLKPPAPISGKPVAVAAPVRRFAPRPVAVASPVMRAVPPVHVASGPGFNPAPRGSVLGNQKPGPHYVMAWTPLRSSMAKRQGAAPLVHRNTQTRDTPFYGRRNADFLPAETLRFIGPPVQYSPPGGGLLGGSGSLSGGGGGLVGGGGTGGGRRALR